MRYRILLIILFLSALSGQSLFNRWTGSDPFMGSPRSTAMGSTHLLNSTGSSNVRFNPANLGNMKTKRGFDFQLNRSSVFERWSMPVRDSFGEFLTHADYVANEFSYYNITSGFFTSLNLPMYSIVEVGIHYAPLTHFNYHYFEEVRAPMSGIYEDEWRNNEIPNKDPYIGSHQLNIDGSLMVTSFGSGIQLDMLRDFGLCIGGGINIIQAAQIKDGVEVDTLNSDDVTNLSKLPDVNIKSELPTTNFITFSATMNLTSNIQFGVSWEEEAKSTTTQYLLNTDSTNGLFQYFYDSSYVVSGLNYMKPGINSLALSFISDKENMMSINFEFNHVIYNKHLNLDDYNQYKFGFEYLTQMGTPIRGGLIYRQATIPAIKPVSIFTFGSGKSIGNLIIDAAGTYCFQSFSYPDLFPVEGDIRTNFDLVRDSQLNLQLGLTYKF